MQKAEEKKVLEIRETREEKKEEIFSFRAPPLFPLLAYISRQSLTLSTKQILQVFSTVRSRLIRWSLVLILLTAHSTNQRLLLHWEHPG